MAQKKFRVVLPRRPYKKPTPEQLARYASPEWREMQTRLRPKKEKILRNLGFTEYEIGMLAKIDWREYREKMRRILREQKERIKERMLRYGISWKEAVRMLKREGERAVRRSEEYQEELDPEYNPYYRLYPEEVVA